MGLTWIGFGLFFTTVFSLAVAGIILWVMMLLDCAQRRFPKEDDKIIWILVLVFTSWLGALIYYFVVKRPAESLKSPELPTKKLMAKK